MKRMKIDDTREGVGWAIRKVERRSEGFARGVHTPCLPLWHLIRCYTRSDACAVKCE